MTSHTTPQQEKVRKGIITFAFGFAHPAKTKLIALLLFFMVGQQLSAQEVPTAEYPYKRDIEKGKYDKAEEKIVRRISRDPDNLECHYAAYQLYSTPGYNGLDYDKAYTHLAMARDIFQKGDEKMLDRWSRDSYSGALFDHDLRRVCHIALHIADSIHTPDTYQHFIDFYKQAPADLIDRAAACRDTLELDIAVRAGTVPELQDFIDRRQHSSVLSDAVRMRDSLAFDGADSRHTTKAYQLFCTTYPTSHLHDRAMDSVYTIEYREAVGFDEELYYRGYAERYPASPFVAQALWRADSIEYHRIVDPSNWQSYTQYLDGRNERPTWSDRALTGLCRYALEHRHIEAARQAARRMSKSSPRREELAYFLHECYLNTSVRNFDRFYSEFPNLMSNDQRRVDSLALEAYKTYSIPKAEDCIRAIAPCHEAFIMLQQLIKNDIDHEQWDNAYDRARSFATEFSESEEYARLCTTLQHEADDRVKVLPLSATASSGDRGDEYAPVVSHDGLTLFFAAKNRPDNIGGDDIFAAELNGRNWNSPAIVMDLCHTYGNEVPMSLSADGRRMLLMQSGKLMLASKTAEGWDVSPFAPKSAGLPDMADASLAPNDSVLLFSSRSLGEHEVDSSLNLFVIVLGKDGKWSAPIELGGTVNTPFAEGSPRLYSDMRTLYFCSEGHGSLGQKDIYKTTRTDDTWTHWTEPENIGRELNTTADDCWISLSANGERAFLSRQGRTKDLYTTNLPANVQPR